MIDVTFGATAAFFGGFVPMQLLSRQVYAVDAYVDRNQNPKRYGTLILVQAAVLAGSLLVLVVR
jgi:hypothetical protein